MSRRRLWVIGVVGVLLVAVWAAFVFGWAWLLLPPGLFCSCLFLTAEDSADASPRS